MSRQPEMGEIPEHVAEDLKQLEKQFEEAETELLKQSARLHEPLFAKRAGIVEKIDKFWPQALTNCVSTNVYIDDDDQPLLDALTKVDVKRDADDPRAATIAFHFAPNDYISDAVLVKEFKLDPKAGPFTAQFDFASETIPQPTTIHWKSDEKNLSKRKPTIGDLKEEHGEEDEEDEDDFEPGSFFSSFFDSQSRQVSGSIGRAIVEDLYPNAVQHYENPSLYEDEEEDEDDEEDEEDEEDDDREIDLEEEEQRPKKKSRK